MTGSHRAQQRLRVALAVGGAALACLLALVPASFGRPPRPLLVLMAGSVLCALVGAVLRSARVAHLGLTLSVGGYAWALLLHGAPLDLRAPMWGALVVVALEATDTAAALAPDATADAAALRYRVSHLVRWLGGGLAAAALAVGLDPLFAGDHPALFLVGAAAGLGAIGITVALARHAIEDRAS